MEWEKFATLLTGKLPAPLLLIMGLVLVALHLFLNTEPPQVWPAIFIVILTVGLAFLMYFLDQWRKIEEDRRKEAEGAAKALRQVVEASLARGGEHRDLWTRPMLQLPLKQSVFENVFEMFNAALREAFQALSDLLPNADSSKVRANVFFPTSEGARDGDVCNLIIPRHELAAPNGLQRNMHKSDELGIAFRPNQGATGRVFVERRAVGVLTNPAWLNETDPSKRKDIERWIYVRLHPEADLSKPGGSLRTESGKSQFEMTDFQNRQVADTLAWIISMPIYLTIDNVFEVVGVFNVDCLEYQLKPEQLRAIYYRLAPFTGVLAGMMRGSPTDRIAIFRFKE